MTPEAVSLPSVRAGLTRLDVAQRLTGDFSQPLTVLQWWADALTALDDPRYKALVLNLPRQSGKTQALAVAAVSELLLRPGSFTLFISASEQQAGSIYQRKIRRPLERLIQEIGMDRRRVSLTKRGLELTDFASVLEVIPTSEISAPGRSPSLILLDECRDIPDPIFEVLAPSVIGAGGKLVMASTAGRPAGFFYEMLKNPAEEVWVYRSNENVNPHADRGVLSFLRKTFTYLSPAARRRELENEFAEDGDSFLPAGLVGAAVDDRLGELPTSPLPAYAFLDLSRRRDLTSLVVVVRDAPRRPEATDHLVTASIQTWDPKEAPGGEVDFAEVRAALGALPERFPGLETVLVDEAAEAGSVLPWAKAHPDLSLLIKGFTATPDSNMKLWGALAARMHAGTLTIPRHERLIEELHNLRQESFTFGSKWRVVDASKRIHRDVSLALAGAVFAAEEPQREPLRMWGGEPDCRSVEEIQAEEEERQRLRAEESARMIRDGIQRGGGAWFPGD